MNPYAPFMFPNFGYNVPVQNPFGLSMPYNQPASMPFFMQSQPFKFGQPPVPSSAQNSAQWNVQSSDGNTFPSVSPVRSTFSFSTGAEPNGDVSAQPSLPERGQRVSETPMHLAQVPQTFRSTINQSKPQVRPTVPFNRPTPIENNLQPAVRYAATAGPHRVRRNALSTMVGAAQNLGSPIYAH
jgi:hypothetical protein